MQDRSLLSPETVAQALQLNSGRNQKENIIRIVMLCCAAFSVVITVAIVFILVQTAWQFFTDDYFLSLANLRTTVAENSQLQGSELSEVTSRALKIVNEAKEVDFEALAERLGEGGANAETLKSAFEQLETSNKGTGAFFQTFFTSLKAFFFDTRWTPLFGSKRFGIWPLINGTVMITMIAMMVAIPLGLLTALYLGLYASRQVATYLRPMVEVLAGIPTVVYGYFALLYITPFVQLIFKDTPIFNAFSAGIMMGVMIIPTVGSISLDAINAVPRSLQDGAYALGSTKMEVAIRVVFPAAASGITAAILLGISRAVGETMIVAIAAGQQPISYAQGLGAMINPFQSVATMTAYIAQVSLGDSPYGSIQYETLFAVGLSLFLMTLTLNMVSRIISNRIRNVYD
jgi:phosphate transport system permease protein